MKFYSTHIEVNKTFLFIYLLLSHYDYSNKLNYHLKSDEIVLKNFVNILMDLNLKYHVSKSSEES